MHGNTGRAGRHGSADRPSADGDEQRSPAPNPRPPLVATACGNALQRDVVSRGVADAAMTVTNQTWPFELSQGSSYVATTATDQTRTSSPLRD